MRGQERKRRGLSLILRQERGEVYLRPISLYLNKETNQKPCMCIST